MSHPRLHNMLCAQLGLKWPLIQAPLGGGPSTPELVAAVSNAGALGSLGAAYLSAEGMEEAIQEIRKRTQHPFAVNLFAPMASPEISTEEFATALHVTQNYRNELKIPVPQVKAPFNEDFEKQFAIILRHKPAVFSYTFGLIKKELIAECRHQKIMTMGTATTLEEGLLLQESGVDAVIAQGAEAGGHRGTFSADKADSLLGTFVLTRLLSQTLHIPVIASGGIMDGNGIASALILGGQAAQLGTAFLLCDEAGTSPAYREALSLAQGTDTRLTRAFSGRWARGIANRFMLEMEQHPHAILPFPAQNALTRDIRKKAAESGKAEFFSLWAGQGISLIRKVKAATLVQILYEETLTALEQTLTK